MVTLESGIQAIIEVAGFAYIKSLPLLQRGAEEDVNSGPGFVPDA